MTTCDLVEAQAAALEVVDRATRRGDDDVDAAAEAAQLLADRLAAVDRQDPRAHLAAVLEEGLGDLHRELAGRDQDRAPTCRPRRPRRSGSAGASAGRRPRSCRSRSGPRRAGRGRPGGAGSPRAGSASAPRSRAPRSCAAAAGRARAGEPVGGSSTPSASVGLGRVSGRARGPSRASPWSSRRSAVSGPRRSVRGRSSGRGASRRRRCGRVAAGMTPATSRSMVASSPAYRPVPLIRTRPPTLRFWRPGAGGQVDGDEVRADHRDLRTGARRAARPWCASGRPGR